MNDELNNKNVETFLYKEKVQEIIKCEDLRTIWERLHNLSKNGIQRKWSYRFSKGWCFTTILKNPHYQRDTIGLGYKKGQTRDIKGKAKVTSDFLTRIRETQFDSDEDESNDYEWDELSFITKDKEIDFIISYSNTYHEGNSS